jgi:glycerol transport system permease protein
MVKSTSNKAWFFVIPALSLLGFVALIPLLKVVNYSFHDIFTIDSKFWVGLEWYTNILGSSRFWESFGRSLLFSAIVLIIEIPLGIFIAISMPKKGVLVAVCLVSISLPLLVPWNMIAMIWHVFLSPDFMGRFFLILGVKINLALNALHSWVAIVLMDVWHWTSLVVLLCYSSLTTIPNAFYSAAAIDGASRWDVFRYVELPKLKGVLIMAIMLRFIDSFMVFIEPFRLNAGGPRSTTTFLAMELGRDVASFDYGPSAARSVIYFMIILSVSWVFKKAAARYNSDN